MNDLNSWHIVQHEDDGMMGQFVVINPGQQSQVAAGGTYDTSAYTGISGRMSAGSMA